MLDSKIVLDSIELLKDDKSTLKPQTAQMLFSALADKETLSSVRGRADSDFQMVDNVEDFKTQNLRSPGKPVARAAFMQTV